MDASTKNLFLRASIYFLMGATYMYYLSLFAPLGTNWLDWHAQKIFNASEYLRLNGYLSSFGFSVWSSCVDCSLSEWEAELYLSAPSFHLIPYILINHIGGKEALFLYGPILDKAIIISTAALVAEIGIRILKSTFPSVLVGMCIFILFISSPWVYKMIIASWAEIFFIFFALLALIHLNLGKNRLALVFFFIAAFFHYIWAAIISFFYFAVLILPNFIKDQGIANTYIPSSFLDNGYNKFLIPIFLISPFIFFSFLRFYASNYISMSEGSSLLSRIGIAGHDIHNGGLIGAIQFLAGNRISVCVSNSESLDIANNLNSSIFIYNCSLSLMGMFLMSLISIVGMGCILYRNKFAQQILVPIIFACFAFIMIFQQALSAHLMGFSYPFAIFFCLGIASIVNKSSQYFSSKILHIIFITPFIAGIVILSTRVSFLTGLNG